MSGKAQRNHSDAGFSLTELAVYILILGIISAIIAAVIVSLFRSEQTVSGITTASNDSQVISTVLTNDIRNARSFLVTNDMVIASVANRESSLSWQCVRWTVSAPSEDTAAVSLLTRATAPDQTSGPSWSGETIFADTVTNGLFFEGGNENSETGAGTGTLRYSFSLKKSSGGAFLVEGQTSNRVASGGTNCW